MGREVVIMTTYRAHAAYREETAQGSCAHILTHTHSPWQCNADILRALKPLRSRYKWLFGTWDFCTRWARCTWLKVCLHFSLFPAIWWHWLRCRSSQPDWGTGCSSDSECCEPYATARGTFHNLRDEQVCLPGQKKITLESQQAAPHVLPITCRGFGLGFGRRSRLMKCALTRSSMVFSLSLLLSPFFLFGWFFCIPPMALS